MDLNKLTIILKDNKRTEVNINHIDGSFNKINEINGVTSVMVTRWVGGAYILKYEEPDNFIQDCHRVSKLKLSMYPEIEDGVIHLKDARHSLINTNMLMGCSFFGEHKPKEFKLRLDFNGYNNEYLYNNSDNYIEMCNKLVIILSTPKEK